MKKSKEKKPCLSEPSKKKPNKKLLRGAGHSAFNAHRPLGSGGWKDMVRNMPHDEQGHGMGATGRESSNHSRQPIEQATAEAN